MPINKYTKEVNDVETESFDFSFDVANLPGGSNKLTIKSWDGATLLNTDTRNITVTESYETETIAFMQDADVAIPNDGTIFYGGTLQETTGANLWTVIDDFVKREKAAGRWNKIRYIRPRIKGTALAHAVNLKDVSKFRGVHFGSWTYSELGSIANGSNSYMTTGFNPITELLTDNIGLSATYKDTATDGTRTLLGSYAGSLERISVYTNIGTDKALNGAFYDYQSTKKITTGLGSFSFNRMGTTVSATLDGVNKLNYTGAGSIYDKEIYEACYNSPTGASGFYLGNIGITATHEALTEAEQVSFTNSMTQLETDLKRGNNW